MEKSAARPRFWAVLQPGIVKLYKVAGLITLTAILIGLVGFLVVNVFYFFDHTWVRPIVLSPTHQKVVEAGSQLADAKMRASQLEAEKVELEASLTSIDRAVTADDTIIKEGEATPAPKGDAWTIHRDVERAKLDKENQQGQRAPLKQRLDSIALRVKDQDAVIKRLSASPYLKAIDGKVVLAFVPYQNLRNVKIGTKLYGCAWGLVACSPVGTVTTVLDGEVTEMHPHDETIQRGVMVQIDVKESAAGDTVLFAGSKPLWLF